MNEIRKFIVPSNPINRSYTRAEADAKFGGPGGDGTWGSITGTLSDQTDLQTELNAKVDENAAITGATKTKITYDAKGLVTAGADATTADIADSSNKRYVTDAQLTVIGNTSGTNTGDQDLSGLVPYTGATTDVDLGANILEAAGVNVGTGSGGVGFELDGVPYIWSDSGVLTLVGSLPGSVLAITDDAYTNIVTLDSSNLTDSRALAFPDASGTIALTSDIPTVPDNLTDFTGQTAWRVFYSNADGDVTELALGADGTFLKSNGASSAPTFATPAGSGDVSKVGTPVDDQVGVWTGDGTLGGDADLTFDTSTNTLATGIVTVTDDAYGAGWNGSTAVPTKNALYDKIETLSAGGISEELAIAYSVSL